MKHLFFLLVMAAMFASCQKDNENKRLCPVVSAESVPASVNTTFQNNYPGVVVGKWFNIDNNGYCALFTQNGAEKKAFFENDGDFQNEEVEQEGENEDNDSNNDCECETDDENED